MSKSNQRDEAKKALADMMSSTSAPGTDQAKNTAVEALPKIEADTKKSPSDPKRNPPVEVVEKASAIAIGEGKAEKISISLHPEDLDRLENFENGLRKAGLVGRRAPTSFLLKVALAAIENADVSGLGVAVAEVTAQDGRRK